MPRLDLPVHLLLNFIIPLPDLQLILLNHLVLGPQVLIQLLQCGFQLSHMRLCIKLVHLHPREASSSVIHSFTDQLAMTMNASYLNACELVLDVGNLNLFIMDLLHYTGLVLDDMD